MKRSQNELRPLLDGLLDGRLNRLFPFDAATEQITTMIYGILDRTIGEFRYVSAGHPGPVHLPYCGEPVILKSEGFPVGLSDEAYEERSLRLGVRDRMYVYSDGVTEAMNSGGQQFGNARLLEAIAQGRSDSLQVNVTANLGEITRWQGAERPQDDISILAVEVKGASVKGVAELITFEYSPPFRPFDSRLC